MAQKFVSLEEAATQLEISKDRLNELREDGKIRAYRDGTSWKFRSDDVEKLAADGIPAADAGSDISLGSLSSLDLDVDSPKSNVSALPSMGALSDIELGSELDLGDDQPLDVAATSDLSLDDLDEPTVPVEGGVDDEITLGDDDIDELSDSILLSENELGESTDRPPSTIIGKAEMAADLDLDMAPSEGTSAAMSDVRLADASTSNVFNPTAHGDALDSLDADPPGLGDTFGDLDELEIDLEAESSRILAPEDVTKAQEAAAKAQSKAAEMSDLELAASDSSPGGVLDSMAGGSGAGLSGLSELELDSGDDDDGGVLGDGSDITLSSESSGINIISPSDSGLALDEVPLELGSGSPLASGLDLGPGSGDAEVGLEPLEVAEDAEAEPFALTPFGEEGGEDEEDSSQVIPLDEVSEEDALLGGGGRGAAAVDGLGDEFAAMPAGAMMPVGEPAVDLPFSMANIAGLSMCMLLLMLCGMMVFDLLRNMWSWGEVYTLNSSLMDVLTPILG